MKPMTKTSWNLLSYFKLAITLNHYFMFFSLLMTPQLSPFETVFPNREAERYLMINDEQEVLHLKQYRIDACSFFRTYNSFSYVALVSD